MPSHTTAPAVLASAANSLRDSSAWLRVPRALDHTPTKTTRSSLSFLYSTSVTSCNSPRPATRFNAFLDSRSCQASSLLSMLDPAFASSSRTSLWPERKSLCSFLCSGILLSPLAKSLFAKVSTKTMPFAIFL